MIRLAAFSSSLLGSVQGRINPYLPLDLWISVLNFLPYNSYWAMMRASRGMVLLVPFLAFGCGS